MCCSSTETASRRCRTPEDPGGCTAPIEVQSAPLCERPASLYTQGADAEPYPKEDLPIQGVPAALYDEGTIIELYTGQATIAIFGHDLAQVRRAADALVAVPRDVLGMHWHLPSASPSPSPTPAFSLRP